MNELSDFQAHGLYSPDYEHDACGVRLVVNINGSKYHEIIDECVRAAAAGIFSRPGALHSLSG